MKINLHIVLLILACFFFNTLKSFTVTLNESKLKEDSIRVVIKITSQGVLTVKDSILFSESDTISNNLDYGGYTGYAELEIKQLKKSVGFIINSAEKNMAIEFSAEGFKNGEIIVKNSLDNKIYAILVEYKNKFDKNLYNAKFKKATMSRLDSFYLNKLLLYEKEFEKQSNQLNNICDSILKFDTSLYSALIADFLKIPTGYYFPITAKRFDNYDALLHWHYFDFIQMNNPKILNHPALGIKIKEYLDSYVENNNLSQQESVDLLMKRASPNPLIKEFVFNRLLDYYLALNIDPAVNYIYQNYAEGCGLNLTSQKLKEINGIVSTNLNSIIPDIVSIDAKGEIRSLLSEVSKNKYTVIYIWTSGCHACQTKTPKIIETLFPFAKKNVGVFSISLDEKKENWLSAILKYKLDAWTNIAELVPIQNSTILAKLNIRSTPKLFLVDNIGKIIAKDIYGQDLENKLKIIFK
jgi:thiol-disulfide isomerase/thioredoxin